MFVTKNIEFFKVEGMLNTDNINLLIIKKTKQEIDINE